MITLRQQKKISKIIDDFMNMKPKAINLFDYSISFITSSKSDYLQRKILIELLNKNINNQRTFFFHIASHYYLTTNNGENPIEELTEENTVDDYYRQIKEIILSVKNNSLSEENVNKIEKLIHKYLPNNFEEEEEVKEEEETKKKVLVIHHGSESNLFWQDIEENFLSETDYSFEFKRFSNDTEQQALYIKELYLNQIFEYEAVISTVLSEEISDQLSALSLYLPIITFNSSIKPLKTNQFEYCGVGNQREVQTGLNLALSQAVSAYNFLSLNVNDKYTTINLEKGLADKTGIVKDFLDDIQKFNLQMVAFFDEINNIAYTKRGEGIKRLFPETIEVFDVTKLKEAFNDKDKIYLVSIGGIGSLGDVENAISEVITENSEIKILLLGVCDDNLSIKNLLTNRERNLTNFSGSEPVKQVEAVMNVLNKIRCEHTNKDTYRKCIKQEMITIKPKESAVSIKETSTLGEGREPFSVLLETPLLSNYNSIRTETKNAIIEKLMRTITFFGEDNNEWAYDVQLSNGVIQKVCDNTDINPKDLLDSTYTVRNAVEDGFQINEEALNNINNYGVRNQGEIFLFQDTYDWLGDERYENHELVSQVIQYIDMMRISSYIHYDEEVREEPPLGEEQAPVEEGEEKEEPPDGEEKEEPPLGEEQAPNEEEQPPNGEEKEEPPLGEDQASVGEGEEKEEVTNTRHS